MSPPIYYCSNEKCFWKIVVHLIHSPADRGRKRTRHIYAAYWFSARVRNGIALISFWELPENSLLSAGKSEKWVLIARTKMLSNGFQIMTIGPTVQLRSFFLDSCGSGSILRDSRCFESCMQTMQLDANLLLSPWIEPRRWLSKSKNAFQKRFRYRRIDPRSRTSVQHLLVHEKNNITKAGKMLIWRSYVRCQPEREEKKKGKKKEKYTDTSTCFT